jgi:hypothetical protein
MHSYAFLVIRLPSADNTFGVREGFTSPSSRELLMARVHCTKKPNAPIEREKERFTSPYDDSNRGEGIADLSCFVYGFYLNIEYESLSLSLSH